MIEAHDRAVQDFDMIACEIVEIAPIDWREKVTVYLSQVRYTITGFAFWHLKGPRYQQYVMYERGVQLVVEVTY